MKTSEEKIIERFQKFDFDSNETHQNKIFAQITAPKRKPAGFKMALASAFSVLLVAGIFIWNAGDKQQMVPTEYAAARVQSEQVNAYPLQETFASGIALQESLGRGASAFSKADAPAPSMKGAMSGGASSYRAAPAQAKQSVAKSVKEEKAAPAPTAAFAAADKEDAFAPAPYLNNNMAYMEIASAQIAADADMAAVSSVSPSYSASMAAPAASVESREMKSVQKASAKLSYDKEEITGAVFTADGESRPMTKEEWERFKNWDKPAVIAIEPMKEINENGCVLLSANYLLTKSSKYQKAYFDSYKGKETTDYQSSIEYIHYMHSKRNEIYLFSEENIQQLNICTNTYKPLTDPVTLK
ncbi:hypothetical protein Dip510_000274 [Elusimicrobium posterum]|uniref:hypothetical protein n=1 Tax=Elusimicrobium posterum TaxID=3116653 RepID=UPI003C786BCC